MLKFLLSIVCGLMLMTSTALAAVNINTADAKELAGLPGIGPAKAARIIEYREQNGEFHSVEELAKVKGIGSKTMERIHDEITITQ